MARARAREDHPGVRDQEGSETDSHEIRVLVVDDHPALQAGLQGLLDGETGITCAGVLDGADGLFDAVLNERPDVVVLDYALGESDGLTLCFRLKQQPAPPRIVLYSAYTDSAFAVPAAMAQADAIVAKSAPVDELLSTIRHVAWGEIERPQLQSEVIEAASARLTTDDLPVAGMLLGAVPVAEIARILELSVTEVRRRALRIIGRLQAGYRVRRSGRLADHDVSGAAVLGLSTLRNTP
jgi:DNA-binding NarL/FixJ family response regulator